MEFFNEKVIMITENINLLRQDVAEIHKEFPNLKDNTNSETQVQAGDTPKSPSKATMDELYFRMDEIDEDILSFAALVDFTHQLPQFAALVIASRMLKVELELILFAIWTNNFDRLQQDFLAWFNE
ncbi:Ff.00g130130.m01.CDS01 [Fusarium sp. VM40]|nr:Ff.00g130130.m01.CDS01 [Fusarium sp. VM40]